MFFSSHQVQGKSQNLGADESRDGRKEFLGKMEMQLFGPLSTSSILWTNYSLKGTQIKSVIFRCLKIFVPTGRLRTSQIMCVSCFWKEHFCDGLIDEERAGPKDHSVWSPDFRFGATSRSWCIESTQIWFLSLSSNSEESRLKSRKNVTA